MKLCKLCQSTSVNFVAEIEGYRRGDFYKIYSCNDCFVSWSTPDSVDQLLYEKIYASSENVPGYSRYARLAIELRDLNNPYEFLKFFEVNYFSVISIIERYSISKSIKPKIAEIGCGKGYLTYSLNQSGFDCLGFDLSEEAINFAKNKFGNYYCCKDITNSELNPQLFDIIICMEIIEHLSNPVEVIRGLLSQLTPKGILVISTPQKNIANKSVWDTDLPPIHLWWFSKKSISYIARHLGVEVDFFDASRYYQLSGLKYPKLKDNEKVRTPFFDENYNLIVNECISNVSFFKKLKNKIRKTVRAILGISQGTKDRISDNVESVVFTLSRR